jgi:hypothetical protein
MASERLERRQLFALALSCDSWRRGAVSGGCSSSFGAVRGDIFDDMAQSTRLGSSTRLRKLEREALLSMKVKEDYIRWPSGKSFRCGTMVRGDIFDDMAQSTRLGSSTSHRKARERRVVDARVSSSLSARLESDRLIGSRRSQSSLQLHSRLPDPPSEDVRPSVSGGCSSSFGAVRGDIFDDMAQSTRLGSSTSHRKARERRVVECPDAFATD